LSLTEAFEQMVFKSIVTIPEDSKDSEEFKSKKVSILEAQDAFLHGDDKTVLTYYSGVATSLSNAKIIYEDIDLTKKAKLALKVNIESILKFITDRSVEKSLSDIKNQLTPMEKPGGNDE
ncbi:MAG: hypothetical protein K2Q18_16380, partial [Bdellovibrionales bacterium]|nr:hypothetical protein [Bdellovibrionales bacterium]